MTLTLFIILVLGLAIGSFLNVVIDRLPKGEEIWFGRSHCDSCHHQLGLFDLIPVLSFLILNKKCRYCKAKIPRQNPFVESINALLYLGVYAFVIHKYQDLHIISLIYLFVIISGLIVIFMVDLKHGIIPDQIIAALSVSTLVYLVLTNRNILLDRFLWGLAVSVIFFSLVLGTRGKGMGFGDVKYAFLMGFILGFPESLIAFYLSFLTGAVFSIILILKGKKTMKSKIPFGPFLVVATLISLFSGGNIWLVFKEILGL